MLSRSGRNSFIASVFSGKERDTESGLDYFGARYYASNMGRFLSPDWSAKVAPVPYAKLGSPQTLNLYAYVLNNPLGIADPNGHELRFINQDQANRALKDFQAGVAPSQRSAITLGTNKSGNIVLNVDAAAAKTAGDSNLGRLGSVTSSDKVAQFQYVDGSTKFSFSIDGKKYSDSFDHMAMQGNAAGGITLPAPPAPGYESSSQPGMTQVNMNNDYLAGASRGDAAVSVAHEVEAHVYELFKTGDVTKSDDKALQNTDIPQVQREARQNAQQP